MNYRILKLQGGFEKDITQGVAMFLFCAGVIFILLLVWILLPSPRFERVKIAMHDEQTFKKLQQKHGKENTSMVVYEGDGNAYFYNQKGEKVIFQ